MISEVDEWLALHRAHEGGAMKLRGEYFTFARPVAEFLAPAFEELISRGLLALGRVDPLGWHQVCVTHSGQLRYTELHTIAVNTRMVTGEHQ